MSTNEIEPTWASLELPLLRAAVRANLDGQDVRTAVMGQAVSLGLDRTQTGNRLESLFDAGYLEGQFERLGAGNYLANIRRPTERARRAVGQWPTADGLAAELAAAFEQAADDEIDGDRKLSLRTAAKAVVTGVATTAITKYMGL